MRIATVAALLALAGCATEPPPARSEPITAPAGPDEAPRSPVAAPGIVPDRAAPQPVTPEAIAHDAIAQVVIRGGVAYVDPERRLWRVDPAGTRSLLSAEIGGRPVSDGETLAWAEPGPDASSRLSVRRPSGRIESTRLEGLFTALAIHGEQVILLGSRNGGVAGVWVATAGRSDARCATNCALRAGAPWGDRYVPPPRDAGAIELDGDRVTFVDLAGATRTALIEPPAGDGASR